VNSRRSFLQNTLLGGLAAGTADFWARNLPVFDKPDKNAFPVVIATWGPNLKANAAAWEVLSKGGYALDAVEAGVRVPEADPLDTSVGYGGFPDRDGHVTLDACIMNELGMAGSVSFLEHIMHPISVARLVMEKTPHVMLVGEGALQFALSQGFKKEDLLTDVAKKAWEAAFKMHGRVGDSPIIGAGMFVDNEVGGAASTGLGEMVLRTLGSFLVVEEMRRGAHPQKAAETAVKRIARKYAKLCEEAQVGFIAVDKRGRFGGYAIHPGFNYVVYQGGENKVYESASLLAK